MKSFPMSHYATYESMQDAKIRYLQSLATAALERLEELEEVRYKDDTNEWHWTATGEPVSED